MTPTTTALTPDDVRMLARLADAVIPPDDRDAGAGAVDAGSWLAQRIANGINAALYAEGLRVAHAVARELWPDAISGAHEADEDGLTAAAAVPNANDAPHRSTRDAEVLDPVARDAAAEAALLERVRAQAPAFFKQLRMDVCARYLSDPGVWQRIGFPGPSIETGGYPDFDRPQS